MKEYVKLYWKHDFDDEPIFIFYEVCIDNERLAKRSIEITLIPNIEEFNSGIWGEEFYASLVIQDIFESVWNKGG